MESHRMASVLVPLAPGFEELEAVTIIDLLVRAGVDVISAGLIPGPIIASRGVVIQPDMTLDDALSQEFDMLVLLAENPGKTYSRSDLLNQVWGVDFEGFEHTVNSHINRLRSKIEKNMNEPEFILTTWGVGYKFKDH